MNFFFFSFSFLFCSFLKGVRGSFRFSLFFLFCANNANKIVFLQIISDLVICAVLICLRCLREHFFNIIRRWAVGVILSAVFNLWPICIFAVKSGVFASFESRKPLVHSVANVLRGGRTTRDFTINNPNANKMQSALSNENEDFSVLLSQRKQARRIGCRKSSGYNEEMSLAINLLFY